MHMRAHLTLPTQRINKVWRATRRWLAFVVVVLTAGAGPAGAETEPAAPENPPGLVLVLSGGGARGAAHIGALRVLEELKVVPDMIIGTSMGSIVGGLYAAGWSPDELEELLATVDWNQVFTDHISRRQLSFRRKQDDRPFLIPNRLHFDDNGFYLPPGLLGGQSLHLLLASLEARSLPDDDFDRLPIPFRAIGADIESGRAVVLDRGSLATAMRASMAIPGVFSPVEWNDHTLSDGGAVANLPIGIAQQLGAEQIIAIDIASPLMSPGKKLKNFWSVFKQMNTLLTVGNRFEDIGRLRDSDIYIRPELGDITFDAFDRARETVALGAAATQAKAEELRAFAVSDEEWRIHLAHQRRPPSPNIRVDRIRIENSSRIGDEIVNAALGLAPPAQIDLAGLRKAVMRLHKLNFVGMVETSLEAIGDQLELVVIVRPPPYTPHSLQIGVSFFDDFEGDDSYTLTARHQTLPLNRRGGEWQNVFQIGRVGLLRSELYQPLDAEMKWFVAPQIEYRRESLQLWFDGQSITEYRLEEGTIALELGRVLGNWGEVRVGAFTGREEGEPRVALPGFPSVEGGIGGIGASFRVDTVDSVSFPTEGMELNIDYYGLSESMGAEESSELIAARVQQSWSWNGFTCSPYLEYATHLNANENPSNGFSLGGPGRLSGLGNNELYGDTAVLARVLAYQRLKNIELGALRLRTFAGVSLEAGNVFAEEDSITGSALLGSWSAFVGAETPIGPVYFGYGATEGGRSRVYLAIGAHY